MGDAKMPRKIAPGIHMVGGPDLTDPRDCLCYLVAGASARVLVDCGAGPSAPALLELAMAAGGDPPTHLLITHAHIDHAGGAAEIRRRTGCRIVLHQAEAEVMATGDDTRSAADWYGLSLEPAPPDQALEGDGAIDLGQGQELAILHTPGHTPGSLVAWCLAGGQKVLFGQDVHGPFAPAFGSDIAAWRGSIARMMELEADILAEGHYGVFRPAGEVRSFLREQLAINSA
ncbi:MAG: MBL fold metallo-hydrolase [Desulfarculaceae bacterium]|nr:MBL fold metallo-hydrolase [Desulfarculaceae bacterium]MCF8073085.1 MBL fold metallo-hydrolase [Desulfarculaceae bacterium]MCF8101830.1 MBL fold metallo-hydrolase [Desulfarculaceae bacterium]MCF8115357.1 MBL fold metallo-hydrolase [Desulfarculaceae bacterium]